ncbi:MAG: flagellar hook assembly protein FlgD [Proteobacteria bacterium]|nr:flagellar hook assembly protein FlgD [Pseudomonadota bacterium]
MTTISPASAAAIATNTSSSASSASASLDANSFLKLLVAELQYQDPSKPMDTTQLVQQMSSMSQVEQSVQTNSKLSSIMDQLSIGQAGSLLGRTVTSADGAISGIVTAVRTTSSGMVATLADGSELTLGQGVEIKQ